MQPSLKHKLAVGGLVGGLVLGAGAVAGGAIGLGALSGGDSARDATEATGVTAPSTPDSAPGTAPSGGGGDETEDLAFVDLGDGTSQTFGAGAAGSVTVSRAGGTLSIVSADPAAGFVVSERQDSGREVEVTFVSNGVRVKFDAELEDGAVRVRVRTRGATSATLPVPTAPTTPTSLDDHGDNRGPGGGFDDGPGDDHGGNRGPGGGDDDGSGSGSSGGGGNSGHGGGDD